MIKKKDILIIDASGGFEEIKAYTPDFSEKKKDAQTCITTHKQYFSCLTLTYTRVLLTVNCKSCVLFVQGGSFSRRF